jgi:hypothetical protein
MKSNPIEVWIHKKTGQLYEHFPTALGYALAKIEIDTAEFTSWSDWIDRGLFAFDDCPLYNPDNFENLGEL